MKFNSVTGAGEIITNLRYRTKRVGIGVQEGLILAGHFLQAESQRKVPVEFGLLRASAYTRVKGSLFSTEVFVGYTSAYALYVHELVAMKLKGQPRKPSPPHIGKYWDPQGSGQAKFLEEPARTHRSTMRAMIAARAKLYE